MMACFDLFDEHDNVGDILSRGRDVMRGFRGGGGGGLGQPRAPE